MRKVAVFIDGAALYFGLRQQFQNAQFSMSALVSKLVGDRDLVRAYYYQTVAPPESKEWVQQQRFFESLRYVPHVNLRLGRAIVRRGSSKCPQCGTEVPEKGHYAKDTDVMMVTDLLSLVDTYDTAILVTGDSDFAGAVQVLKDRGKTVEVAFPQSRRSKALQQASDVYVVMDERFMDDCWQTGDTQSSIIAQELQKTLEFYKKGVASQKSVLEICETVDAINQAFQVLFGQSTTIIHLSPQMASRLSLACLDRQTFEHNVGLIGVLLELDIDSLRQLVRNYEYEWRGLKLLEQFLLERGLLSSELQTHLNYLQQLLTLRNKMLPYHQPSRQVHEVMAKLGLAKSPSKPEEWQSNWDIVTGRLLESLRAIYQALELK